MAVLDNAYQQKRNVYFMQNNAYLEDNVFKVISPEKHVKVLEQTNSYLYQERVAGNDTALEDKVFAAFYFRADSHTREYRRQNYSVLEYLGDVGGLIDVLAVIGLALTTFFTSKLLVADIIKQLYTI